MSAGRPQSPPGFPPGEGRQVLLVEDESRLRDMLTRAIHEMGFVPTAAPQAEAALRHLDQRGDRGFDILIVDLNLPGIGGLELLEQVRSRWPLTQAIILTGFGDLEAAKQAIRLDVVDFLSKPCPLGELLHHAQKALRGAGTRPSGQRVGSEPREALDQVVRRLLRILPQQFRQRFIDVAVAVFARGAEQPAHQIDGPGDPGEPRIKRACERLGPQHVDGILQAGQRSVGSLPVAARPSELSAAHGQAGGPGHQGRISMPGNGRGADGRGKCASQVGSAVLECTGQQGAPRRSGPLKDRSIAARRVRHAHQPVP